MATIISKAADALSRVAHSITESSLGTAVVLNTPFVQTILKDAKCPTSAFPQVVERLRQDATLGQFRETNPERPLELVFHVSVPDAAKKEKVLKRFFASPTFAPAFAPVSLDDMFFADYLHTAQTIVNYGVFSVTVVTAPGDALPNRREAIYGALATEFDIDTTDRALLPPFVPVHQIESVAPERRQYIVVDRGHRFGTAEHYAVMKAFAGGGITYVGHLQFPPVHPGISLRVLLGEADRWDKGAMQKTFVEEVLYSRIGDWTASINLVAHFAQLYFGRDHRYVFAHPKRRRHPFFKELLRRSPNLPIEFLRYRELNNNNVPGGCPLVLDAEAIPDISLDDWLNLLSGGWSPCYLVGLQGTFEGRATVAAWIKKAPIRFRQLACDHV